MAIGAIPWKGFVLLAWRDILHRWKAR